MDIKIRQNLCWFDMGDGIKLQIKVGGFDCACPISDWEGVYDDNDVLIPYTEEDAKKMLAQYKDLRIYVDSLVEDDIINGIVNFYAVAAGTEIDKNELG